MDAYSNLEIIRTDDYLTREYLCNKVKELLKAHNPDCPLQGIWLGVPLLLKSELDWTVDDLLSINNSCEMEKLTSEVDTLTLLHGLYHSFNDQPALSKVSGYKAWYYYDAHHRLRGPAIVNREIRRYFVYGKQTTSKTLRLVRRFATNLINHKQLKQKYQEQLLSTSILPHELMNHLVLAYVL